MLPLASLILRTLSKHSDHRARCDPCYQTWRLSQRECQRYSEYRCDVSLSCMCWNQLLNALESFLRRWWHEVLNLSWNDVWRHDSDSQVGIHFFGRNFDENQFSRFVSQTMMWLFEESLTKRQTRQRQKPQSVLLRAADSGASQRHCQNEDKVKLFLQKREPRETKFKAACTMNLERPNTMMNRIRNCPYSTWLKTQHVRCWSAELRWSTLKLLNVCSQLKSLQKLLRWRYG